MIDKNEMLLVVDENNNPVAPKPRDEVHTYGYWHRTSHVWMMNDKGQILVQKRSMLKDSSPGKWEPFFGGHMEPDVEYIEGAIREIHEELGLEVQQDDLEFFNVYKAERSHEFQGVFIYRWNGNVEKIEFEKEEIDLIQWFDPNEIYKKILIDEDPNWTKMGYEKAILEHLTGRKNSNF